MLPGMLSHTRLGSLEFPLFVVTFVTCAVVAVSPGGVPFVGWKAIAKLDVVLLAFGIVFNLYWALYQVFLHGDIPLPPPKAQEISLRKPSSLPELEVPFIDASAPLFTPEDQELATVDQEHPNPSLIPKFSLSEEEEDEEARSQ